MLHRQFELAKSGLATGILVVALGFQMLPFFFLILVMAYGLGVSGAELLVSIPVVFLILVVAASWLASKRTRRVFKRPPRRHPQTTTRPVPGDVVLIKTRDERYQDLKDILGQAWR